MGRRKDYSEIESKMRINLSEKARSIIQDDMELFEVKSPSAFINTIYSNFHVIAKSSINQYLKRKEMEYRKIFSNSKIEKNTIEETIHLLLQEESNSLKRLLSDYKKTEYGQVGKIYYINKSNTAILQKEFADVLSLPAKERGFYISPSQYMKCLIEEYCNLPFYNRELIFKRDVYLKLQQACEFGNIITIATKSRGGLKHFRVKPYCIMSDSLKTRSYLACLSVSDGHMETEPEVSGFALHRIEIPESQEFEHFVFTESEKREITQQLTSNSIQYLREKQSRIVVKLTPRGKDTYQRKITSRPVRNREESTDYVYVFYCSEMQAYNYFFIFGRDAEILEPASLRDKFIYKYSEAHSTYISTRFQTQDRRQQN